MKRHPIFAHLEDPGVYIYIYTYTFLCTNGTKNQRREMVGRSKKHGGSVSELF